MYTTVTNSEQDDPVIRPLSSVSHKIPDPEIMNFYALNG